MNFGLADLLAHLQSPADPAKHSVLVVQPRLREGRRGEGEGGGGGGRRGEGLGLGEEM